MNLKGRIIGKEGRNIRAFEAATGVDIIVDDTPEAIIISGFDPFRREIARIAMERLIADGRIHPARIEEVVQKVEKELNEEIMRVGEQTITGYGYSGCQSRYNNVDRKDEIPFELRAECFESFYRSWTYCRYNGS